MRALPAPFAALLVLVLTGSAASAYVLEDDFQVYSTTNARPEPRLDAQDKEPEPPLALSPSAFVASRPDAQGAPTNVRRR